MKICDNGDFTETSHLTSDGSIDITGVVKNCTAKTIKDMYGLITAVISGANNAGRVMVYMIVL